MLEGRPARDVEQVTLTPEWDSWFDDAYTLYDGDRTPNDDRVRFKEAIRQITKAEVLAALRAHVPQAQQLADRIRAAEGQIRKGEQELIGAVYALEKIHAGRPRSYPIEDGRRALRKGGGKEPPDRVRWYCEMCDAWVSHSGECKKCGYPLKRQAGARRARRKTKIMRARSQR